MRLLLFITFSLVFGYASACSCLPLSISESYHVAPVVFEGKLIKSGSPSGIYDITGNRIITSDFK